jgi:hypothetical protein
MPRSAVVFQENQMVIQRISHGIRSGRPVVMRTSYPFLRLREIHDRQAVSCHKIISHNGSTVDCAQVGVDVATVNKVALEPRTRTAGESAIADEQSDLDLPVIGVMSHWQAKSRRAGCEIDVADSAGH